MRKEKVYGHVSYSCMHDINDLPSLRKIFSGRRTILPGIRYTLTDIMVMSSFWSLPLANDFIFEVVGKNRIDPGLCLTRSSTAQDFRMRLSLEFLRHRLRSYFRQVLPTVLPNGAAP